MCLNIWCTLLCTCMFVFRVCRCFFSFSLPFLCLFVFFLFGRGGARTSLDCMDRSVKKEKCAKLAPKCIQRKPMTDFYYFCFVFFFFKAKRQPSSDAIPKTAVCTHREFFPVMIFCQRFKHVYAKNK